MVSIPVNELPAGTSAVKITLQWLQGTGTVWVDDVRCEEGVSRKEDKTYYYHCDYLGSPRVMTDQLGNVIWRQDYYAFGGDYASTSLGNTHKFTGHVQDAATGQYYAKARYFTTSLGRFSQPEPLLKGVPSKAFLVSPQKLNPYVYCLNNPTFYSDPNGKNEAAMTASLAGAFSSWLVASIGPQLPLIIAGGVIAGLVYKTGEAAMGAYKANQMLQEAKATEKAAEQKGGEKTNPYTGSVDKPVIVVDGSGNAIPVEAGQQIDTDPSGKVQEVKDKNGNPTGTRMDGKGHPKQTDPKAQQPHGHRVGSDGKPTLDPENNPHLPINQ